VIRLRVVGAVEQPMKAAAEYQGEIQVAAAIESLAPADAAAGSHPVEQRLALVPLRKKIKMQRTARCM